MNMAETILKRLEAHLEMIFEDRELIDLILDSAGKKLGFDSVMISSDIDSREMSPYSSLILKNIANNGVSPDVQEITKFILSNIESISHLDSEDLYKIVMEIDQETYVKFLHFLYDGNSDPFENLRPSLKIYVSKVLFYSLVKISCDKIGLTSTLKMIERAYEIYRLGEVSLIENEPIIAIFGAIEYCSENQEFPFEWLLSQAFQVDVENNPYYEKVSKVEGGV